MKLVLAGSRGHFERFKEVLWRKDKDVSEYRYVSGIEQTRGYPRDTKIVILASFNLHPNYGEILACCKYAYDMRPLTERSQSERDEIRRQRTREGMFQSDGIIRGVLSSRVGGSYLTASMINESIINHREHIAELTSRTTSDLTYGERLRGISVDNIIIDEPDALRYSSVVPI